MIGARSPRFGLILLRFRSMREMTDGIKTNEKIREQRRSGRRHHRDDDDDSSPWRYPVCDTSGPGPAAPCTIIAWYHRRRSWCCYVWRNFVCFVTHLSGFRIRADWLLARSAIKYPPRRVGLRLYQIGTIVWYYPGQSTEPSIDWFTKSKFYWSTNLVNLLQSSGEKRCANPDCENTSRIVIWKR